MTAPYKKKMVILVAGGTGGHVFPAAALAEELLGREYALAYVTDQRGTDVWSRCNTLSVHAAGPFLRPTARLPLGMGEAFFLLRRLKPAVVVGFGGSVSVPTIAAAVLAGYPTVVHEQNAVLGRANRLLIPWVRRVAVSCPPSHYKNKIKDSLEHTGLPVRREIQTIRNMPYVPPDCENVVRVLIIGGSQGARVLSDVMPETLSLLPVTLRTRLRVSQQVRAEDSMAVVAAYGPLGIDVEIASFFNDVSTRLAETHLVIARAGASTVAELTVSGRPAILVPYPHATDDHQTANARIVAETGGAWLIPQKSLTPAMLARKLQTLFAIPTLLTQAAMRARRIAVPDAAQRLADIVESLSDRKQLSLCGWRRRCSSIKQREPHA